LLEEPPFIALTDRLTERSIFLDEPFAAPYIHGKIIAEIWSEVR
jgi:hypothetical protein